MGPTGASQPAECPMCGDAPGERTAGPRGEVVCPACGEVLRPPRDATLDEDPDAWAVGAIRPGGISLTIIGGLMLAYSVASAVALLPGDASDFVFIAPPVQLAASLVVIAGGVQMFRHRSWGLAFLAAVVALLPVGLCCFLTFPAPIAVLVVLTNPKAREAFGEWV